MKGIMKRMAVWVAAAVLLTAVPAARAEDGSGASAVDSGLGASIVDSGPASAHFSAIAASGQDEALTITTENDNQVLAESVNIEPIEDQIISVGSTCTFKVRFKPEGASDTLVWDSTDTSVATIDTNGTLTALKEGETVVSAMTQNVGASGSRMISNQVTVYVTDTYASSVTPVAGIMLSQTSGLLHAGDTMTLTATVSPADATDPTVVWTSSDPHVATVKDGVVTAAGAGEAVITASSKTNPDVKAEAAVTVRLQMKGLLKMQDGSPARYKRLEITPNAGSAFSMSTEYEGTFEKDLGVGTYRVVSLPYTAGNGKLDQKVSIQTGDTSAQWELQYPTAPNGKLQVDVTNTAGHSVAGVQVSLYAYVPNYYYMNGYTDANGTFSLDSIPLDPVQSSTVYVNCWTTDGAYGSQSATLSVGTPSQTVQIVVPTVTTITGRVVSGGHGVPSTYVEAQSAQHIYGSYTAADGSFSIRASEMAAGTYSIRTANWSEYATPNPASVVVSSSNATYDAGDIEVTTGISLSGRVLLDGRTDNYSKAYVCVYTDSGAYVTSGYAASGAGFGFDKAIKDPGKYKMYVSYIYDQNGWYMYNISSEFVEFTVTDFNADRIIRDISVKTIQNTTTDIFSGDGNALTTDRQIVKHNDKFTVIGKYQNNSPNTVTATFKTTLSGSNADPAYRDSLTHTEILKPGQSGRFDIRCLTDMTSKVVSVKTTVTVDGRESAFGLVGLEVIDITLSTASTSVKVGEKFKVYGEADRSSHVTLLDQEGDVLSVLSLSPEAKRWYSAEIQFSRAGEYQIYARVIKGNEVAVSAPLRILVADDPIAISTVQVDQLSYTDLPFNSRIGIRTFSHSVYPSLEPWPLTVRTRLSSDKISSFVYHFAGKDFTAQKDSEGKWASPLTGWRGTGILQLTATVKTTDGQSIGLIIAEVAVLVDPIGYVTDADTGLPVPGALVECFVAKDGNTNDWVRWDSESHGQPANPLMTGENGYYGWNMPTGIYRVSAQKSGYESISSDSIQKYADGINVPPPVLDVDLKMVPTTPMSVESVKSKDGKIILTFSRHVRSAGVTVYKDGQALITTQRIGGNQIVISSGDFRNDTEYQVEVKNVTPKNEGKINNPAYTLKSFSGSVKVTGVSRGENVQPETNPSKSKNGGYSGGSTWNGSSRSLFSSMKITPDNIRNAPRIGGNAVITLSGANPKTTDKALVKALNALGDGEKLTLRQIVKRIVTYQITIDPATLTTLPANLNFGLTTVNQPVQSLFEKYFSNKISIITLRHTGDFGFTARLAVKVDVSEMDPNNIHAYYYDIKSNSYRLIPEPNLIVDANGYVHLSVTKGGVYVISSGPLKRR